MKPLQVNLEISNGNNMSFPEIIMRKFFSMIFIDGDGRKMSVYTAVAFNKRLTVDVESQTANDTQSQGCSKSRQYLISGTGDDECWIKLKYSVEDEKGKNEEKNTEGKNKDKLRRQTQEKGKTCSVNYENLTESLFSQVDRLKEVWATDDNDIYKKYTKQEELNEAIKNEFGVESGKVDMKAPVLYFCQPKKDEHKCFLSKGVGYSEDKNEHSVTLKTNLKEIKGVESLYWVRTQISLPRNVLNSELQFSIKFTGTKFLSPDFSWYIAPPEGYLVDVNSTIVEYEKNITGYTKQEKLNALMPVSDETTVPFDEWISDELIENRTKFRIRRKEVVDYSDDDWLSDGDLLKMRVKLKNPSHTETVQFICGILLAFILAVCFDRSIMTDAFIALNVIESEKKLTWIAKVFIILNPMLTCGAYLCYRYKYVAQRLVVNLRKLSIVIPMLFETILLILSCFEGPIWEECFSWKIHILAAFYLISIGLEGWFLIYSKINHKSFGIIK